MTVDEVIAALIFYCTRNADMPVPSDILQTHELLKFKDLEDRQAEEIRVRIRYGWLDNSDHIRLLIDKSKLPIISIHGWFKDSALEGKTLTLPSNFAANWVEQNYRPAMLDAFGFVPTVKSRP